MPTLEIPITISTSSYLFPIFQKVMRQVETDKKPEITIKVLNQRRSNACRDVIKDMYKFKFDWLEDNVCGIEVFHIVEYP